MNMSQMACEAAVNVAWITHSSGETNKKVNSIGSVMPVSIEVIIAGSRIAFAIAFFSGFAVW